MIGKISLFVSVEISLRISSENLLRIYKNLKEYKILFLSRIIFFKEVVKQLKHKLAKSMCKVSISISESHI